MIESLHAIPSADGTPIAYAYTPGSTPGVVFLHGYRSDMEGGKALALEAFCREQGIQFTRFDCRGHGRSGGDFLDATLSHWLEDALAVLDNITQGPQVLVGSSMGGHIMLLCARARPDRVAGLIGIAAAADFTEKLMWERGTPERQQELLDKGVVYLPSDYADEPYPITLKLIEDGRGHLLLDSEIPIDVPVTLLHGVMDEDVPWEHSMILAAQLRSQQVDVLIRKDADHRFSRTSDIAILRESVDKMLARCQSL